MSAPITEAHRKLRDTLEIRWMRATELEIEQLIAESEAEAVQTAMLREYGNLSATNESLAKERDQLRAALALGQLNCDEAYDDLRAERDAAEAELAEWHMLRLWGTTPEIVHAFIKCQQARIHAAQDIEAELAAERARLDWLELRAPKCWGLIDAQMLAGKTETIRAAIDANIKEGAK
jgi:hypothetical protein